MPTPLDDVLVPEALAMIDELGVDTTFTVLTGTYSPGTGDLVETPVNHVRKATPLLEFDRKLIDGAMVQDGDAYILVAASGLPFTPANNITVTVGTQKWKVVRVRKLSSGEQVAAYELQLRR